MPQAHLCIDCGRTVQSIVRGRCRACSPAANKERRAKHGHMTGRNTPARQEHQAFLSSTGWRKLRKAVIARDQVCTRCGSAEDLTVHHIVPVRTDPSMALDPDNCITLCRRCHAIVEGGRA